MSAYVTREDLERRFGAQEIADLITDDNGDEDVERLDAAIADASTTIDGYLASRYTLPLASVPALVTGWAADIARYELWDEKAPEEVRQRYEDVMSQLKDLARGLISLPPGSDGTPQAQSAAGAVDGFSADRIFTMDTLRDF